MCPWATSTFFFGHMIKRKMSANLISTRDSMARSAVKTASGVAVLPQHQASNSFVPASEVVRTFTANTQGQWGSYSEWTLTADQMPDVVDNLVLQMTIGAATKTGGSVISFVNDGAFLNRLVEVYVGAELVTSMYPESQYINRVLHTTAEGKTLTLKALGNDAVATRRTNAAAGHTLYIPISLPWISKYGFFTKSFGSQLRLRVHHATLADVAQTDGTAPVCVINAVALQVSGRSYLNQANVGALVAQQRKNGKNDERFVDPLQQQITLPSGSTSYTVQLTNFQGIFDSIFFVVRAAASVGTPLANDPDAFVAVASFSLLDGAGNIILPATTSAYALGPYLAKYISGDGKDNDDASQKYIYPIFFGNRPEETLFKGTQHGLHRFDGTHKLVITFASALAAGYVIDVVGRVFSNLSADSNGVIKKSLVTA